MSRKKQSQWPKIGRSLKRYDQIELINLLKEVHDLSDETKLFLETRILQLPPSTSLKPYKNKLRKALQADPQYNDEIDWDTAEQVIMNYRLASGDEEGLAELLVYYVEVANQFTLEYGDINEDYYESVENSFQRAVDHLLSMDKTQIDKLKTRLKKVVDSAKNIGWGYHDTLTDIFYIGFGK